MFHQEEYLNDSSLVEANPGGIDSNIASKLRIYLNDIVESIAPSFTSIDFLFLICDIIFLCDSYISSNINKSNNCNIDLRIFLSLPNIAMADITFDVIITAIPDHAIICGSTFL